MPKSYPQTFKDTSKQSRRRHITLYRVTLTDGSVYRFAQSDTDIVAAISGTNFTFQAFGHRRGTSSTHVNLQVDSMDIDVPNRKVFMSDGVTTKRLGDFALQGLLDNSTIEIFVWDGDNPTVNAVGHSTWIVQQCVVSRSTVRLRCESQVVVVDREAPRTIFQELCNNQLYDKYCGASRAAFEVTTTLFGGPIPTFRDFFNRSVLGSDWTQDGTGNVTLDGDRVTIQEPTALERVAIKRAVPTGRPTMAEVDVDLANMPTATGWRTFVFAVGDNPSPLTAAYRIDLDWNGSNLFSVMVNGSAEFQFSTIQSKIKMRVYWNGTTAWGTFSLDGGVTWKKLSGRAIAPTAPQYWLIHGHDALTSAGSLIFNDYDEWSGGDVGLLDSRVQPSVAKLRIRGAQASQYYDAGEATMQTGSLSGTKRTVKSHVHADREVARFAKTTYSVTPDNPTDPQNEKMTDLNDPKLQGNAAIAGWTNVAYAGNPFNVNLDFGAARTYRTFVMSFMEFSPGGSVQRPAQVEFFKSADDITYTSLGIVLRADMTRVDSVIWSQWYRATLTLGADDTSRFVRARITPPGGNPNIEVGEFTVRHSNGEEELVFLHELPLVPLEGDSIKVAPGCDKRLTTCKNKFNNLVPAAGGGFRGFPTIPKPTDSF